MNNLEILREIPIFSNLPDTELETLDKYSVRKSYQKDNVVFFEQDKGNNLFVINSGRVKVSKISNEGKEIILAVLGQGDFFGEMSLLDGEPRSATIIAIEKSELTAIRRDVFLALIERQPRIAIELMAVLSQRLREANRKISNLALLDVYGRLARVLMDLARSEGRILEDGRIAFKRPTHQALANMIGTSRETVTRSLGDLQRRGFLKLSGKEITIRERFQRDLD